MFVVIDHLKDEANVLVGNSCVIFIKIQYI